MAIVQSTSISIDEKHFELMKAAIQEAEKGSEEGGIPIGAALANGHDIIATGRNRRIQDNDPIMHAEINCLQQAGRMRGYKSTTLYSTLMPCFMCAGAIVQFGIKRVVIGESRNFKGARSFLESHGVEVIDLDDAKCRELLEQFIIRNPDIWYEDIGL
jgi:creatinine deaminase